MIHNPYNQVRLDFSCLRHHSDSEKLKFLEKWRELEGVRELSVFVNSFHTFLREANLKRIHKLVLNGDSYYGIFENTLELLAMKNVNESLQLHSLSVEFNRISDVRNLPAVPGVVELSLSCGKFTDLQWLDRFSDVKHIRFLDCCFNSCELSVLDNFRCLEFLNCTGLNDISCLNNNSKIIVKDHADILDFSKSFKKSRLIKLEFKHYRKMSDLTINVANYPNAETFTLNGYNSFSVELSSPLSNLLRYLHLSNLNDTNLVLPPNNLRTLTLRSCHSLRSIDGIENICSINLYDLPPLIYIVNVAPNNKSMTITGCSKFNDFYCLKYCESATISDIPLETLELPIEVLDNLKELTLHCLSPYFHSFIIGIVNNFKELRRFTYYGHLPHLTGFTFPKVEELETDNLLLFTFRSSSRPNSKITDAQFPNLQKIIVNIDQDFFTCRSHIEEKVDQVDVKEITTETKLFQLQRRPGKSIFSTFLVQQNA